MKRYQTEHFCLLVHAQDHWELKDENQILKEIIKEYALLNNHSNCEICMTCPVCQALWNLFDPINPGDYNTVCQACKEIYTIFKEKRGKKSGLILFSHDNLPHDKLKDLVEVLLNKKRIKKISMLQLEFQKIVNRTFNIINQLETRKVCKSDFINLLDRKKYELNVNYEISKEFYY